MMINCSNPLAQYLAHKGRIDRAVAGVMKAGQYILGREVEAFEREFSAYIGTRCGLGVGSGTEALHIALRACGIGAGDEVITSGHTAVATVAAIELAGARPVLVDIEPDYYTIDPEAMEKAISPKTKAVIAVHIYGQPADLSPIIKLAERYGIRVIEDCAQAHGAEYLGRKAGSWGSVSCFSFYPTKNLGAMGDGGMILTDDRRLGEKMRLLREYGWKDRYNSAIAGWNSRLDELQAAILRVKLRYLDKDNEKRRTIAGLYDSQLKTTGLNLPPQRPGSLHVYHIYAVRSKARDRLREYLKSKGITTLVHYPIPIHLQDAYKRRLKIRGPLRRTERVSREVLSLPIYPEFKIGEANKVVKAIQKFTEVSR